MKSLIKLDLELRHVLKARPGVSDYEEKIALRHALRAGFHHPWIEQLKDIGFEKFSDPRVRDVASILIDKKRKLVIKALFYINKHKRPQRRVPTLKLLELTEATALVLQPLVDLSHRKRVDRFVNIVAKASVNRPRIKSKMQRKFGDDFCTRNAGTINNRIVVFDW